MLGVVKEIKNGFIHVEAGGVFYITSPTLSLKLERAKINVGDQVVLDDSNYKILTVLGKADQWKGNLLNENVDAT